MGSRNNSSDKDHANEKIVGKQINLQYELKMGSTNSGYPKDLANETIFEEDNTMICEGLYDTGMSKDIPTMDTMRTGDDCYHTDPDEKISTQDNVRQNDEISDDGMSHEILKLIINSVEKRERRRSAKKHKRKRSTFANSEANGSEADDEKTAYSRCSITYLFKVLERVRSCPRYMELVEWLGFAEILHLDDCVVPRFFVQWVADNVSIQDEAILIGGKPIQLSPEAVVDTLGTPTGDLPVDSDEELGKAAFLAIFGLTEVPSIKFFGKMILSKEMLPDGIFCRCFMSVCLGTFYCPNSNTKLSTKYMGALVVVDKIKDRNWSKFIHEWLMLYIKKYLKQPVNARQLRLTLGGCIYHLAVRCLDFIDFSPIQIPSTLPRIRVWKGNLIKVFSDMYIGTDGKYGAYPVKHISQTCYSLDSSTCEQKVTSESVLKQSINTAIGGLIDGKLKEDISGTFLSLMKDEDGKFCMKALHLVIQVIKTLVANKNGPQETEKLSCSDGGSFKTANESQTTLKIPTDDEGESEDDDDENALIHRKRRRTEVTKTSELTNHSEHIRENDINIQHQTRSDIHSRIVEDIPETDYASSQVMKSASLEYMAPQNNCNENDRTYQGFCTENIDKDCSADDQNKAKSSTEVLNKACIDDENNVFSGFRALHYKQVSQVRLQDNVDYAYSNSQQDQNSKYNVKHVNHPTTEVIDNADEICARKEPNPAMQANRGDYLQIARYKYYWQDTPSFRLVEEEDDHGTTIEEPELYRPVGMDDDTYNKRIDLAILKYKKQNDSMSHKEPSETPSASKIKIHSHSINHKNNFVPCATPSDGNIRIPNHSNIDKNNSTECEMTIQCAQKVPSVTGLTNTPKWQSRGKNNIVDLVTPEAVNTSQDHMNFEEQSYTDSKSHDYRKILFQGRRLFEGNDSDYRSSSSKNSTPVREMLNKIGNPSNSGVGVLGERSFTTNCNIMSQQTDDIYNSSLPLASSNSSLGKENYLPQRIPHRSRFVCSPFDVNPSSNLSVQPFEKKIWEAVTTLCDMEEHKTTWAIFIDKVRVSMLQLGNSMKINGKLEAWLMNAFCRKFFRDNHPRISLKHFFFNTVSDYFLEKWKNEDGKNFMHKQALKSFIGANQAQKLDESDGLYFPTVFQDHWFVFMVDLKYRNFIFLDSWYGKDSAFHKAIQNLMINNFRKTWEEARLKRLRFETFGRAYPNVPRQEPGNDCGIYSLKYMELYIARNPAQCAFSHLDIPTFRIRYAHDILMMDHNEEYEAKFLACGFQP